MGAIKNMSSLLIKDICDVIGKQEYMAVRDVSVLGIMCCGHYERE
jgi:hypothetical protein